MEIRIGITNTARELSFDSNASAAEVAKTVTAALDSGDAYVTFTDDRGSSYIVPTAGLAFVQVGTEESRRVGFVA